MLSTNVAAAALSRPVRIAETVKVSLVSTSVSSDVAREVSRTSPVCSPEASYVVPESLVSFALALFATVKVLPSAMTPSYF